jgi:hypothetical protein
MRRAAILALCVVGTVVAAGRGDTTATRPNLLPAAEQLIQQLGEKDYRKRDAAMKALEALGAPALPALRKARDSKDPEVRRRLDDLIPALETAVILTPKRVSLKMTKKPAKDILDEISKQTGYKLEMWNGGNNGEQPLYSFQFDNLPFWDALDEVCAATGLVIQSGYYGDDRLRFQHLEDSYMPYVHRDGVFRFSADNFSYGRTIQLGSASRQPTAAGRRSEYLNFNFWIYAEPKLPILSTGQNMKLIEAYDEDKNSMIPPAASDPNQFQGRRFYYGGSYRSFCQQAGVNLVRPSERSRMVKLIRGTVPVTLLAEQKPEVLTDKLMQAKGKKFRAGSASINVEEIKETPAKQYELKLSIQEDGRDNDYTWMNSIYQRVEVQDEKGVKFQFFGTSYGGMGNGNVQVTFTCGPTGNAKVTPPAKLIFYTWSTLQYQVNFEFRDLPLP